MDIYKYTVLRGFLVEFYSLLLYLARTLIVRILFDYDFLYEIEFNGLKKAGHSFNTFHSHKTNTILNEIKYVKNKSLFIDDISHISMMFQR
jgi:hypothetical protein